MQFNGQRHRHWTDHQNAKKFNCHVVRTSDRNAEQRISRERSQLSSIASIQERNFASIQSELSFNSSGDRSTKRLITKIQLLGDTVAIRRSQMNHISEEVRNCRSVGLQCEGVIVGLGPKHYVDSDGPQTLRIGDRFLIPNHLSVTYSLPHNSLIFELFRYEDILAPLN
ncbi:hypothetical protein M3Y96_00959700 [Aphelenchoides besseyi]|nr:hypothetical protein M3Y96_00959700 [Aphelenchoides besseyi]